MATNQYVILIKCHCGNPGCVDMMLVGQEEKQLACFATANDAAFRAAAIKQVSNRVSPAGQIEARAALLGQA